MFKKWTVFLTYEWIQEVVTWKDTCSSLKQNQCFFYLIRFVQKFEWFVFLNIFVFVLKIFTSYLRQSQFCVTFARADNDNLILQRTNNTRRIHKIYHFQAKKLNFFKEIGDFWYFIFIVVYFFVTHFVHLGLII